MLDQASVDPGRIRESVHRMVPDPEVQPTMTVPDAGRALGLGRASSYEAARAGTIPTIRIGRRLAVPTAKFRTLLGLSPSSSGG